MGIFGQSKKDLREEIERLNLRYSTRERCMIEANTKAIQIAVNAKQEAEKYKRLYIEQVGKNKMLEIELARKGKGEQV